MPNYRTTPMPYQNHRQMHTSSPCKPMQNDMSLAMAYIPWQIWREIYDVDKGFHCGTIFKELNLPFLGKGGVKR